MKKIIFHIIPKLTNGGAETVLTRLVEEFSKVQYEQVVISIQGDKNDFNYEKVARFSSVIHAKEDALAVKEVFQKYPEATLLAWMYKGILKAHQWKQRFRTDQKIIWNIRRSSFGPNEIYQKLSLYVFGIFSRIKKISIIYCAYQAQKEHHRFGFYKGKSRVIQNGLAKKMIFEKSENPPIDNKYFLYVGRHNHAKGPDRLMEVAQKILPKYPRYSLLIAGNGWESDMIPPSLKKQIILLGNVKQLVPLYTHATALAFTSYTEGYPNVLVEAAVCGTPIIGFSAGDSPFILDNHSLGVLVEDTTSFCAQLQKFIEKPVLEQERTNAANNALEVFDFKQTYKAYHDFIFSQ